MHWLGADAVLYVAQERNTNNYNNIIMWNHDLLHDTYPHHLLYLCLRFWCYEIRNEEWDGVVRSEILRVFLSWKI